MDTGQCLFADADLGKAFASRRLRLLAAEGANIKRL